MTINELQGDDNEIFVNAAKGLEPARFHKLAYTNVIQFLNSKLATYDTKPDPVSAADSHIIY